MLYYQLNIDYIIDTYCVNKDKPELQCNGKCHLAKQLQLADSDFSNEQSSFNIVYEAFYPVYFQIQSKESIQHVDWMDTSSHSLYQSSLRHTFTYNCFHPPRVVV